MSLKAAIIGLTPRSFSLDINSESNLIQTHAKAYSKHKETKLVAACDPNAAALSEFIEHFSDVNIYDDYLSMMATEKPDIVSVCTWPDTHAKIISEIIAFGPKVIFCEKPISFTVPEAVQIITDCLKHDVELIINLPRRFDAMHQEIAVAIQHGLIGNIIGGTIYYTAESYNSGSDAIDLACLLLGGIQKVQAFTDKDLKGFDQSLSGRLMVGRDTSLYLTSLQNQHYPYFDVQLYGSLGHIHILNSGQECELSLVDDENRLVKNQSPFSVPQQSKMMAAISHVVDVACQRKQNLSSGENALETLRVILSLQKSYFNQGTVLPILGETRELKGEEVFESL